MTQLKFYNYHMKRSEIWLKLVSCPDPSRTCEKEGLVFWATFLVKWGGVAPRGESSNQIAERVIICDDIGNRARDLALQTEGKLLSQLIYVFGRSKVGRSLHGFCKACLAQWIICKLYSSGLNSSKVVHNPVVRCRCWIEGATLLDTGRAIVQTAQLGIILHAGCNAWWNAFFMPFNPPPWDKKRRSEHQTLFPIFGECLGTRLDWYCQLQ